MHSSPSSCPQSLADSSRAGTAARMAVPLSHVPPCHTGSGALRRRILLSALHSHSTAYCRELNKTCTCYSSGWIPESDPTRGILSCTHSPASTSFRLGFYSWFSHFCNVNKYLTESFIVRTPVCPQEANSQPALSS